MKPFIQKIRDWPYWSLLLKIYVLILTVAIFFLLFKEFKSPQWPSALSFLTTEKSSDKFKAQYELYELRIEADIHKKMKEIQIKSEADWVFFWGFHNGTELGPFHINRMSVLGEVSSKGKRYQVPYFQNISTTQFATSLTFFWKSTKPRFLTTNNLTEDLTAIRWTFESVGIYGMSEKGIKLWSTDDNPIGFIGLYFDEEKTKQLEKNPLRKDEILEYTKDLGDFISAQLQLKYFLGNE